MFPVPVIVVSSLMCLIHLLCCAVAKSCLNLNESVNWSIPGSSVHHYLPEFAQINAIESVMLSKHGILCRSLFLCLQPFPASESLLVSWLFGSGGQSIGASASASVLPMNIQGWFPLGLIGLISLPSKGLSRVCSSTTVQQNQFFGIQLSLWSNSHIYTWLLEKP